MHNLPNTLYSVNSVIQLEKLAIKQYGIPAYELMKRAGEAVFNVIQRNYSNSKNILVLCGAGNNAGDGYVVASLAQRAGFKVSVISLIEPDMLKDEAQLAYQDWLRISKNEVADFSLLKNADVVVDALLGTGLAREVSGDWARWIDAVHASAKPVVCVDIPSGLLADTGVIAGTAIKAEVTISFIGLKQGMFTAQAKDVCGEIIFSDLGVPEEAYSQVASDARLMDKVNYALLPKRKASSHKGCFGHILIVGGNEGMPGAVILAATAALRAGAGLVTIITTRKNLPAISQSVPEAMIKTCELDSDNNLSMTKLFAEAFINDITHLAIGMGLGQDDWALALMQHCVKLHKPMLIDADALNILAENRMNIIAPLIVTPHPGEAARLLSNDQRCSSADIQNNRFAAIRKLHALFAGSESCAVILKGSGTLLFDGQTIKVCALGSAAMAAPGMGDVLSGITIGLWGQNIPVDAAAELAVCLHATAADSITGLATEGSTRGLLASDIVRALPGVLQ